MNDKSSVLERLDRRDAQRIEKIQKAHNKAKEENSCIENEDYFSEAFKTRSEGIEQQLCQVPTLETQNLPSHFENVKRELNELQKYVINSSFFLSEFRMRKFMGIIQNLQTKCYELEDHYVPRKKFGFTKKKLTTHEIPKQITIDENDHAVKQDNKWDEKLYGFDSIEDKVLSMADEELYQRDVTLRNLKNCTVSLKGVMGTLHMTNLENCIILTGPVTSSVFVEKCTNCKFVTACQQLRVHTSTNIDIYLHVTSQGIIEDCSAIQTAPYNLIYDNLEKHFKMSALDSNKNNWNKLADFNWLNPNVPSPNWSVLAEPQRIGSWEQYWQRTPL